MSWLKTALGYDDSLDVFGVHCVGGILGALLTGVFSTRRSAAPACTTTSPTHGRPLRMLAQLISQLWGVGMTLLWSGVVVAASRTRSSTWSIGLRVTEEQEREGLDTVSHGERGYNLSAGGRPSWSGRAPVLARPALFSDCDAVLIPLSCQRPPQ